MLIALLALAGGPARAAEVPARLCHAAGTAPAAWNCTAEAPGLVPARGWLRFTVAPGAPAPTVYATRLTRFDTALLTAAAADGRSASRLLRESDFAPGTDGWTMRTALPDPGGPVRRVELRIDGLRHVGMLSTSRLEDGSARGAGAVRHGLLVAALCGLLCAPLLFNFAFWRVLRQRFLIWHTLAVVFMLAQTVIVSGLINHFASLSLYWLSTLSTATFSAGVAAAALFSADVIEPGKLDRRHRRLLVLIAPWVAAFALLDLYAPPPLVAVAVMLYFVAFIPVLALFGWTMAIAWRRGSRAVRFQLAAWLPFMMLGAFRIASTLGATAAPVEVGLSQHLAIVAEILITGLAVVDRFMVMREQRDNALVETRLLEDAVDRDPLTGLLNRRALEAQFALYYAKGFRTVAVIDLDHFKLVNDRFGHAVGDKVLRVVGSALAPDDHTRAIRLGGEEFMLLLRGRDAAARAEQRRNAIPLRVAAEVAGLDRVVTASMGLVEQAAGAVHADFPTLYAHCDRLLYEAKRTGRNRTMAERLQNFTERRGGDRREAAAVAAA